MGLDFLSINSVPDLESELYVKKHGYQSLQEYYYKNSPYHNGLERIRVPTLILNAGDDPIVVSPTKKELKEYCSANANVMIAITASGGHLGFMGQECAWSDQI